MPVNLPVTFKGMALPFGCLILLGFMAAGLKAFVSRRYPEFAQDREPEVKPEPAKHVPDEATEVEVFDEFWEKETKEDVPEEIVEEKPQEYEEPEKKNEEHSFGSVEEIEEFFKSLGLDVDTKGDEQ